MLQLLLLVHILANDTSIALDIIPVHCYHGIEVLRSYIEKHIDSMFASFNFSSFISFQNVNSKNSNHHRIPPHHTMKPSVNSTIFPMLLPICSILQVPTYLPLENSVVIVCGIAYSGRNPPIHNTKPPPPTHQKSPSPLFLCFLQLSITRLSTETNFLFRNHTIKQRKCPPVSPL